MPEATSTIHLDAAGNTKRCAEPRCPAPSFETGFGLAGGGYGPYEYCTVCGLIISKTVAGNE